MYFYVQHDGDQDIPHEVLREMVLCIYENARKFWRCENNHGLDPKLNMLILKDILSQRENIDLLVWIVQFTYLDMGKTYTEETFCETIKFELSQS